MNSSTLRTGSLHWTSADGADREDMILLHSLGTDLRMWKPQLDALSSVRRILAIDLPGHGRSTARRAEYRLDDLGQDVMDIVDEAGVDQFDVCGISIGGLIALWLAISAPDRVRSLVASNTAARIGSRELWSERMAAVSANGMEGILAAVIPRFFTDDFAERQPATFAEVEQMFMSVDPTGYIGCCAALRDADLRDSVSAIRCPTLLLGGEVDLATPPAEAEWLHRRIDGSRVEIIRGAAHLANLDQPEAFNGHLLAALEGGEAGEAGHQPGQLYLPGG